MSTDLETQPGRAGLVRSVGLGLIAVLAAAVVLASASAGPGITPDSVIYLEAAHNLRQGQGLSAPTWHAEAPIAPLTHYPPLLPVLLAGLSAIGLQASSAAVALNAVCQALSVFLLALLVRRATGLDWLGLLAGTFLALSPRLMDVHVSVLSEPPFLALTLLCLYLLIVYLQTRRRWLLGPLAAAAAMAVLARYVGVVVIATIGLSLLAWNGRSWKRRLGDAILFGLSAGLPLVAWLVRNKLVGGSAANRQLAFHPPQADKLLAGLEAMGRWFLASYLPSPAGIVFVGVLVAAALATAVLLRRPDPTAPPPTVGRSTRDVASAMGLLLLFSLLYVGFLLVSITFVDAHTPLDNRLLTPLLGPLVGLLACLVVALPRLVVRRWLMGVLALGLLGLAGAQAKQLAAELRGRLDAEGFASRAWQRSSVLQNLATANPSRTFYSNWPDLIHYLTGRTACLPPVRRNPYSLQPNADYAVELERMEQALRAGAWLVWLDEPGRSYLGDSRELVERLNLRVLMKTSGGTIYVLPRARAATTTAPATSPAGPSRARPQRQQDSQTGADRV